jgi:hypothetical protein
MDTVLVGCRNNLGQKLATILWWWLKCWSHTLSLLFNGMMMVLRIKSSWQPDIPSSLSRLGTTVFVRFIHKPFHLGICFIEILLSFFLANAIFKAINWVELIDSAAVELVNALESFLTQSFLVVSEEETPKFLSLEKVFAVILGLRHSKDVSPVRSLVCFRRRVLSFHINFCFIVLLVLLICIFIERPAHDIMCGTQAGVYPDMVSFLKEVSCFLGISWPFQSWLVKDGLKSICKGILCLCIRHHWLWVSDFNSYTCEIW